MAPKKASKTSKATGAPEGFTPERFERELKDLAAKAKEDTWTRRAAKQTSIYLKTALILGLLGVASSVSQLNLSPVYGSIPSAVTHAPVIMAGCFVGWAFNLFLRDVLPLPASQLIPIISLNVPAIQYLAGGFSDRLGCWWGPLVTETLTLFPLAVFSAACVADQLEDADLSKLPSFVAEAAPGLCSWSFFRLAERIANENLQALIGSAFWFTRVGLELVLASIYAVFSPSKYLVLAIPALLHTAVLNTHVMTPMATASLNSTLAAQNWTLLERKESLTGYISILENLGQGFRVMRCDHSLLGGEWVRIQGQKVSEPIYGVFVMLEAVRLIQRETPLADADAKALVV